MASFPNCYIPPVDNVSTPYFPRMYSEKDTLLERISKLTQDQNATSLAQSFGLKIQSICWEDTARHNNSCYGPNISDMTLCVNDTSMPIIRRPNYADITCDIPIEKFKVKVGNEKEIEYYNSNLTSICLKDYLKNISTFTNNPMLDSLYLNRDKTILTSTQACILPLNNGKIEFNVKLFNYQYSEDNPAVLVIIVSDQGTSTQIINKYNQKLFFNKNGRAAYFKAQRLSEYRKKIGSNRTGKMNTKEKEKNMLFIFQIPLKQREIQRDRFCFSSKPIFGLNNNIGINTVGSSLRNANLQIKSEPPNINNCHYNQCFSPPSKGMEDAILKVGRTDGDFVGTNNLKLERDTRFPIRCTIQYYKVTDTPNINSQIFQSINKQLSTTYDNIDDNDKGSLVIEKSHRQTKHNIKNIYSPTWINYF